MFFSRFHLVALVLVSWSLTSGKLSLAREGSEGQATAAHNQASPVSEIEEVIPELDEPLANSLNDDAGKQLSPEVDAFQGDGDVNDEDEATKLYKIVWADRENGPKIKNTETFDYLLRLKDLYSESQNVEDKVKLEEVRELLSVSAGFLKENCDKEDYSKILSMFEQTPHSRVNLFNYLYEVFVEQTKVCLLEILDEIVADLNEARKGMFLRFIKANNIDMRRNGRTETEISDIELYYEGIIEYLNKETSGKISSLAKKKDGAKFEEALQDKVKNICYYVKHEFASFGETYIENEYLYASKLSPHDKIWIAGYKICLSTLQVYDDLVVQLRERLVTGKGPGMRKGFRQLINGLLKSNDFQQTASELEKELAEHYA